MYLHANDKLEVQVLPCEGFATHAGLRVMGIEQQCLVLSVDRGMCRHGIELRNNHCESRPRWVVGKATRAEAIQACLSKSHRSHSPVACTDACRWNTGGPVIVSRQANWCLKVCDRTKHIYDYGKSDTVIVVMKFWNKGGVYGN